MNRTFQIAMIVVALSVGCATLPEKMNKETSRGNYEYAIVQGEKYIEKKPDGEHLAAVLKALEKARFKRATSINTPESYANFNTVYPESTYRAKLMERWAEVEYKTYTRKTDTLGTYQDFLSRFPEGPYAQLAKERIAKLVWRQVDAAGTLAAYQGFMEAYPESPCAAIAFNKVLALAWAAAEAEGTFDRYYRFGKSYLETDVGQIALGRAHDMGWVIARRQHTVEGYHKFRTLFPKSIHEADAFGHETKLAWARAEERDDEQTYRWYAAAYPGTFEAVIAEERAADWAYFNSPTGGEMPFASVHQVNARDPNKVWLYVDVRDRSQQFVAGLRPDQFTVYENGRSAPVDDFLGMESKRPIDIIFVVDVSGSMSGKIETVKGSAIALAEELRFRQRDVAFGLVTFCDFVHKVYGNNRPTPSAPTFQKWMATIKATDQGRENPIEALLRASQYKFRKESQKVLILVTDEPPNVPYDPKSKMNEFDVGKFMADGDFTFYAITPEAQQYRRMLDLAGGRLFDIKAHEGGRFQTLMSYIGSLLSTQYRIAFASPRQIPNGGNRRVRVRVDHQQTWLSRAELEGQVVAMFTDPTADCSMVAITRESGLFRSTDCGARWEPLPEPTLSGKVVAAVGGWGNGVPLYLLLEGGKLVVVKGGSSVEPIGDEVGVCTSMAWSEAFPKRLWVTGSQGLWLSEDMGRSFVRMAGLSSDHGLSWVNVAPQGQRVCTLAGDGQIWCQDTSQGRWWSVVVGAPGTALPAGSRLYAAPFDSNLIFLRWGTSALYRSRDGGRSWHQLVLPDTGALGQLFFAGGAANSRLCLAAERGLYCSTTLGRRWVELTDGTAGISNWLQARFGVDRQGHLFVVGPNGRLIYQLFEVATREVVSGEVFFDTDQDEPKADLIPHLYRIGGLLANDPTIRARVDGHTDSDGSDAHNLDLSQRRADRVRSHLQAGGGRPSQMETMGHGEARPLVPNTSSSNKAKNRRVEILLIRDLSNR